MFKKRSRKQILFIVIVGAVVLVLLAMAAGFIVSSKYAGKISRSFLDLNRFKQAQMVLSRTSPSVLQTCAISSLVRLL